MAGNTVSSNTFIHPTAHISENAEIGAGCKIWINVQIRENAQIGQNCIISKDVYIDHAVKIGKGCKVQNSVSIYHGVEIGDDVFVGAQCLLYERQSTARVQHRMASDRNPCGNGCQHWRQRNHCVWGADWRIRHGGCRQRGDERCSPIHFGGR
jgi:acetyltransferase-like isoleucine patch superfamily enzyme